jgi:hypothetical protein
VRRPQHAPVVVIEDPVEEIGNLAPRRSRVLGGGPGPSSRTWRLHTFAELAEDAAAHSEERSESPALARSDRRRR